MTRHKYVSPHRIRTSFAKAMSDMYQSEVPLYGDLLKIVSEINHDYLEKHPNLESELGDLGRVSSEKHGAIRLGKAAEMRTISKLFAVMDMHPVGYYNLSVANLPVHSTAFRPITKEALAENPFRIFCSLLRLDLLDEDIRSQAKEQLNKREIFSEQILTLIDKAELDGGLNEHDANDFVKAAVEIFKWHSEAAISKEFYEKLLQINGLVADIVGFKGPHINHLTPRILDIDTLHSQMKQRGIAMIPNIQGPPKRKCDILLRQTSFQALSENTVFPDKNGKMHEGKHRARFGEIEQRGIALTPKGRELYDTLLQRSLSKTTEKSEDYEKILRNTFKSFPDDYKTLRTEKLAYFEYHVREKGLKNRGAPSLHKKSAEQLIDEGYIRAIPITYEDFLPVSAAGIFKSNLVEGGEVKTDFTQNREDELADAIGSPPLDPFALYEAQQNASLAHCFDLLGIH